MAKLPGVTVDEVIVGEEGSITCSGENLDTDAIIAAIKGVGFGAEVAD